MKKTRIGILFGGVSGEHEVSLMSAGSVINEISTEKYEIIQLGISQQGQWWSGKDTLDQFRIGSKEHLHRVLMFPFSDDGRYYKLNGGTVELLGALDVIFPVLHGTFGEDGNLQGYLELMDIPYVGASVSSSSVCMEKGLFKDIMRAQQLPVVDYILASRLEVEKKHESVINHIERQLRYPVFVKPVNLGSSIGVHRCNNRDDLTTGLMDAVKYSRKVAVEQAVDAWEIEVSVLGNEHEILVSVPGEVRYNDTFYSYKAKYDDAQTELVIPASVSHQIAEDIRRIAGMVYRAVGCEGMARIDFLVEKISSKIYVNELNTIPGFTHASMFPRLWVESGMTYANLIDRMVELAFERHHERGRTKFYYEPQE